MKQRPVCFAMATLPLRIAQGQTCQSTRCNPINIGCGFAPITLFFGMGLAAGKIYHCIVVHDANDCPVLKVA